MFCQSRMQGGRYASPEQIQSLRSRGAEGLDRPKTEKSENHPPSRLWQVRGGWGHDQTQVENAVTGPLGLAFSRKHPLPPTAPPARDKRSMLDVSLIHISEPTRL